MRCDSKTQGFVVAMLLGLSVSLPSSGQQVPSSDTSHAKIGSAGTTYRIQSAGIDKAQALVSEFKMPLTDLTAPETLTVRITYPSSDRVNRKNVEVMNLLKLGAKPAIVKPGELIAHTNYVIISNELPNTVKTAAVAATEPVGESPESFRAVYGVPPDGGAGVIAIVDAFSYPEADSDLETYSQHFHLPSCRENKDDESKGCLQKYPQTADHKENVANIDTNCGWAGESALDLEATHALAPNAKLIYVQARSDSYADLFAALKIAQDAVAAAGGGQISMSWGGAEYDTEQQDDSRFTTGALYFASTGDHGGDLLYPAVSRNVIAVGGTTLIRTTNGDLAGQTSWESGGGGVSQYEPAAAFQNGIENITAGKRNVPDIAADANPRSGMAIYANVPPLSCIDPPSKDQELSGWLQFGGTSLAAPLMAAITNAAGHKRTTVLSEQAVIYGNRKNPNRIKDITLETGPAGGNHVLAGYDRVTGVGTPSSISFDADAAKRP